MNTGYIYLENSEDIEKILLIYGANKNLWWNDIEVSKELHKLIKCTEHTISRRKFNQDVHNKIVKYKLDQYFRDLKKEKKYLFYR